MKLNFKFEHLKDPSTSDMALVESLVIPIAIVTPSKISQ